VEDRARCVREVERALIARELVQHGELTAEVSESIGLFAAGRWSVAMLGTAGEREFCVRAGSDGRRAVLAVQRGEQVRFRPVTAPSLLRTTVGLLPPLRPGPGGSVTVPKADLIPVASVSGRDEFTPDSFMQRVGQGAGRGGKQLAIMESILRRPRTGAGYFVASARSRNGREGQPVTLTWLDTDVGRYAVVVDDGYVTCGPADRSRIEQHLARLMAVLV
jgi:hypothetical protein